MWNNKASVLFIVPAEYAALKEKGVEGTILERDEGGFFGKVITVHPLCSRTKTIALNDRHEIHEVGFDLIPGASRWRWLSYMQLPVHFARIIWRIVTLARKYRVDFIRANDPFWMGFFAYLTSQVCRIPYCVSIHADYDKRMELDPGISISTVFGSYSLAKRLERFVLSRANMVLPIRETLARKAIQNGARPEVTRVIPHGVDLRPYTARQAHDVRRMFDIDPERKIISFVGRFSRENYLRDILEITAMLHRKRSDFVLLMVGGGREEPSIRSELRKIPGLSDCVVLTGFQPREICIDIRRESAVSLCLMAGFSLIEACAAASPVVSYDVEWHYELVKNNETGLLVREHDVSGAVAALDWLLDHPLESRAMGQRARDLAFSRHDLQSSSVTKVRLYSEILAKR